MAITKTKRLELRTNETTDRLITEAANLLHVSKTAFVTDAARQAAERVVARTDVTLMSPEIFDAMMESLDTPDESSEIEVKARLPRLIQR
ncbi:toxin-antitoxin system protein [Paenarthrobacter ureafaciens]|uniref:type II toxin-antitoxin system TacA family antitoxin n=1 Tax=Paenarthrobacter ureafaciens TaxID=37931 RepID=UPI0015BAB657|nr:toxin-antitoxin system protein [Paenarthrobacter ureafaciens]